MKVTKKYKIVIKGKQYDNGDIIFRDHYKGDISMIASTLSQELVGICIEHNMSEKELVGIIKKQYKLVLEDGEYNG